MSSALLECGGDDSLNIPGDGDGGNESGPDATTPVDSGSGDTSTGGPDAADESSSAGDAGQDVIAQTDAADGAAVSDSGDGGGADVSSDASNDGKTTDASDASSDAADADAGLSPVYCAGSGSSARACGTGDSLPPWTYSVTFDGGAGTACATLGADAGSPSCAPCTLASASDSPQCPVSIPIDAATWSLAYDPVNTYVYVTEVVSSCPSNGGWTPPCH
jgi:hypothetical protein